MLSQFWITRDEVPHLALKLPSQLSFLYVAGIRYDGDIRLGIYMTKPCSSYLYLPEMNLIFSMT